MIFRTRGNEQQQMEGSGESMGDEISKENVKQEGTEDPHHIGIDVNHPGKMIRNPGRSKKLGLFVPNHP
jgi:hypothetical protein